MALIEDTSIRMEDNLTVTSQYVCYHVKLDDKIIYRRFREFIWLRDGLSEEYPGSIVPSLPSQSGGFGNTEPEFIDERKIALSRFLNKCMTHYEYVDSASMKEFLCGKDMDMVAMQQLVRNRMSIHNQEDEETAKSISDTSPKQEIDVFSSNQISWFGRLSNRIQSFKTRPLPFAETQDDRTMLRIKKTVKALESKTSKAYSTTNGLTGARLELCDTSVEWAQALVIGAQNETETEPSQAPSMEGVCRGLSGRMLYFGEMSQRGIGATAQQENKLLAKLLTERIEMLAATRHALAAREKVLKELIHARAASFHCGEAVNRARSAEGKDREKLQADLESTQKSHYLAQAVVLRLDKKLKAATTRLTTNGSRINDEWVALFKASLLEVAFANQRMHQMQYASLSTMRADLEEEGHREHDLSQEFTPSLAAAEVALSQTQALKPVSDNQTGPTPTQKTSKVDILARFGAKPVSDNQTGPTPTQKTSKADILARFGAKPVSDNQTGPTPTQKTSKADILARFGPKPVSDNQTAPTLTAKDPRTLVENQDSGAAHQQTALQSTSEPSLEEVVV